MKHRLKMTSFIFNIMTRDPNATRTTLFEDSFETVEEAVEEDSAISPASVQLVSHEISV